MYDFEPVQGSGDHLFTMEYIVGTDLLAEERARDSFLSPDVELLGFRAFKRVCHTCCDPIECTQTATDDLPLPPCPRRR